VVCRESIECRGNTVLAREARRLCCRPRLPGTQCQSPWCAGAVNPIGWLLRRPAWRLRQGSERNRACLPRTFRRQSDCATEFWALRAADTRLAMRGWQPWSKHHLRIIATS